MNQKRILESLLLVGFIVLVGAGIQRPSTVKEKVIMVGPEDHRLSADEKSEHLRGYLEHKYANLIRDELGYKYINTELELDKGDVCTVKVQILEGVDNFEKTKDDLQNFFKTEFPDAEVNINLER